MRRSWAVKSTAPAEPVYGSRMPHLHECTKQGMIFFASSVLYWKDTLLLDALFHFTCPRQTPWAKELNRQNFFSIKQRYSPNPLRSIMVRIRNSLGNNRSVYWSHPLIFPSFQETSRVTVNQIYRSPVSASFLIDIAYGSPSSQTPAVFTQSIPCGYQHCHHDEAAYQRTRQFELCLNFVELPSASARLLR